MGNYAVFVLILMIGGTAVYLAKTSLTQPTGFRITHLVLTAILFFIAIIPTGHFQKRLFVGDLAVSLLMIMAGGTAVYMAVTSQRQPTGFRIAHLALATILFLVGIIPSGYFYK